MPAPRALASAEHGVRGRRCWGLENRLDLVSSGVRHSRLIHSLPGSIMPFGCWTLFLRLTMYFMRS